MEFACVPDAPGDYTLTVLVTPIGVVDPIAHLFVVSSTFPAAPDHFEVGPLAAGDSEMITLAISGAMPGDTICLDLALHNATLEQCCEVTVCLDVPSCGTTFVRGDCNADGSIDISDAITMLSILFSGAGPAPCDDACDANDDGSFNIGDAIFLLTTLFSSGAPPPPPNPNCGADPTVDPLGCLMFPPCP